MSNCPARGITGSPSGSSSSVQVSAVSCDRERTRYGRGAITPRAGSADADTTVDVQESETRVLEAVDHDLREALHELVAEPRVLLALPAKTRTVEGDRAYLLDGARVEVRAEGREQPGPADDVARVGGLDHEPAAVRCVQLESDPAPPYEVEGVRDVALPEEERTLLEAGVLRAAGDERQVLGG